MFASRLALLLEFRRFLFFAGLFCFEASRVFRFALRVNVSLSLGINVSISLGIKVSISLTILFSTECCLTSFKVHCSFASVKSLLNLSLGCTVKFRCRDDRPCRPFASFSTAVKGWSGRLLVATSSGSRGASGVRCNISDRMEFASICCHDRNYMGARYYSWLRFGFSNSSMEDVLLQQRWAGDDVEIGVARVRSTSFVVFGMCNFRSSSPPPPINGWLLSVAYDAYLFYFCLFGGNSLEASELSPYKLIHGFVLCLFRCVKLRFEFYQQIHIVELVKEPVD